VVIRGHRSKVQEPCVVPGAVLARHWEALGSPGALPGCAGCWGSSAGSRAPMRARIQPCFVAHFMRCALPVCPRLQARALAAFRLDPERWGVNVQPYSGRWGSSLTPLRECCACGYGCTVFEMVGSCRVFVFAAEQTCSAGCHDILLRFITLPRCSVTCTNPPTALLNTSACPPAPLQPRQLCRVHRAVTAPRPHHGPGPALRRPPHPRLLHRGGQEDLGHLHLL
jgi:hypothetical protein